MVGGLLFDCANRPVDAQHVASAANGSELNSAEPFPNPGLGPTGLVEVPSCARNIRALALAMTLRRPVLLRGPTGSGKSGLVEHLWEVYGKTRAAGSRLLRIQMVRI